LEEHVASIFKVEEEAKQETSLKQQLAMDYTALYPRRYSTLIE
jgi:hypothetical protein